MKRLILLLLLVVVLTGHVHAMDFTVPTAPEEAQKYMPEDTENFSEGLIYILREAFWQFQPKIAGCFRVCSSLVAIAIMTSVLKSLSSNATDSVNLVSVIATGMLLLRNTNTLILLGVDTVQSLSDYSKLFLPVMATATAAQGGTTTATAVYSGAIIFITVLTNIISKLIIPLLYIFLCLSIANSAIQTETLKKIKQFSKWIITWILKISIYIFTGYISITGIISGTVDSSAIKATKIAMSGVVPVVGSVISDASETVLISAGIMKNSAGIYGIFATLGILIGPFIQVGSQYLVLKITDGICNVFSDAKQNALLHDFGTAMGMILGMIGTISVMLLIGTVCFMKGVTP